MDLFDDLPEPGKNCFTVTITFFTFVNIAQLTNKRNRGIFFQINFQNHEQLNF